MSKKKDWHYHGPTLTGWQYEALCRHVISRLYFLPIEKVHSGRVDALANRGQNLKHQIDLYWDVFDGVCEYRVFANAKWRKHSVQVGDLMEVIGVWRDIGAHKAMIITNSGFDTGVIKQAEEKGIALLVVQPTLEFEGLSTSGPALVQEVEQIAAARNEPVYSVEVVHKAWNQPTNHEPANPIAQTPDNQSSDEAAGVWLIGGSNEIDGIENKSIDASDIQNAMMERVWTKDLKP
jgi:hypothetical protein